MDFSNMCPPVYIFGGIILPLLVALTVIVIMKYKRNSSDKKNFLSTLLFYLLLALLFYFLINWLCENKYSMTANFVAFLPFLAYIYVGYMFVNSEDCMSSITTMFKQCLKI
jgi:CDP-diglyceride synthetase